LVNNDGLLIAEYALLNKVDYAKAQEVVLEKITEWNEQLNNGIRITLDKVGYLFFDQEKNLCFEQDRFFNLLMESYGLGKVHFISEEDIAVANTIKAVKEQKELEEVAAAKPANEEPFKLVALPTEVQEERSNEPIIIELPKTKRTKLWRYAAAVILAPIAFYSFWIPMNSNVLESGIISFRDFNLKYKSTDGLYIPSEQKVEPLKFKKRASIESSIKNLPNDVYVYAYPFDEETYIAVKLKDGKSEEVSVQPEVTVSKTEEVVVKEEVKVLPKVEPAKPKVEAPKPKVVEAKQPAKVVAQPASVARFQFVVGSFSTKENAQVLVDEMNAKGFKALVLPNGNSFRVSAGKASSETEIRNIATKAKENGYNGWILR